jgi:hypothetical protein
LESPPFAAIIYQKIQAGPDGVVVTRHRHVGINRRTVTSTGLGSALATTTEPTGCCA